MISLNKDGSVVIRRQLDSRTTNSEFESGDSKQYSEIVLAKDGAITLQTVNKGGLDASGEYPQTLVHLYPKGGDLSLYTTSKLNFNAKKEITMASEDDITIIAKKELNLSSMKGTKMVSQQGITTAAQTKITTTAMGGMVTTSPTIKNSGNQTNLGSDKGVGPKVILGRQSIIGACDVNFISVGTNGDIDTMGDFLVATKSNRLVAALQSFVMDKAVEMATTALIQNIPGAAALAGLIQMGSNLYTNFKDMSFNDIAVTTAGMAAGTIIGQQSPFFGEFMAYANDKGIGLTSIEGQMNFLTASKEEGGFGLDLSKGMQQGLSAFENTMIQSTNLWNQFGSLNMGNTILNSCMSGLEGLDISGNKGTKLLKSLNSLSVNLNIGAFNSNVGTNAAQEPQSMVPISSLKTEGSTTKKTETTSAGIEHEITETVSIEDSLNDLTKYTLGDWRSEVERLEREYDAEHGTNSAQYASTNRKYRRYTGKENQYVEEVSPCVDEDQKVDRLIKRFVAQNLTQTIRLANQSWKNYLNYQKLQLNNMSSADIEAQEQRYHQIYGNDD